MAGTAFRRWRAWHVDEKDHRSKMGRVLTILARRKLARVFGWWLELCTEARDHHLKVGKVRSRPCHALDPTLCTLPQPSTLNPKPETRNPEPETRNQVRKRWARADAGAAFDSWRAWHVEEREHYFKVGKVRKRWALVDAAVAFRRWFDRHVEEVRRACTLNPTS